MKKGLYIFFVSLLLALGIAAFFEIGKIKEYFYQQESLKGYSNVANEGILLFSQKDLSDLRVDEYFLMKKIAEKRKIENVSISSLKNRFADDAFKRLADRNDYVAGIQIQKKDVLDAIGKNLDGNFYSIKNSGGSFGLWNDILVKSLYCDVAGFDDQDFFILKLMHKGDGGYLDTHFLLSLLLLKENGCYKKQSIDEQIDTVSDEIVNAEEKDRTFGDLYVERIVFLYWAGRGNAIEKNWIDFIADNFSTENGWIDKSKEGFSVHVSGLSILALLYYVEGDSSQHIY